MSDKPEAPLYWTDVYLKGQEEFLKRWTQMAGVPGAAPAGNANPFAQANPFANAFGGNGAMPDWASMFSGQFSGAANDVARRYFSLYEQYMGATRSLWDVLTKSAAQPDPSASSREFMNGVTQLQQQFTSMWSSAFSQFTPGGTPAAGPAMGTSGNFGMPELPALGLTRERQEAMKRMQHLVTEYAQQQQALTKLWGEIIGDALKTLGENVGAKLQKGEMPQSPKALYDLWVESAELAYARAAHSPAYAKAQADLGNTVAKLRTEQRMMVETVTRELDLPTRAELNTVHRRIKEMKTEIRQLRAELDRAKPPRAAARNGKAKPEVAN